MFGGRAAGGGEAPEALRVRWLGAPRASAHRGVAPALLALGGPDLLLYLYARVTMLRSSLTFIAHVMLHTKGLARTALMACSSTGLFL